MISTLPASACSHLGRGDQPGAESARIADRNLGDWYHANDQRNVTPKSKHQLDVDGRWFKVLQPASPVH
jgi:hypothetical protein